MRPRLYGFALAGVLLSVAYALWIVFHFGGDTATVAVEDIAQAAAPFVAALSCAYAATQAHGRTRAAWFLLAGSAAGWSLGEAVWSVDEVGFGVANPFPSLADARLLAAFPLFVAGILTFPSAPAGVAGRVHLVLDGGIITTALLFVGWAVGLHDVSGQTQIDQPAKVLVLAYPAADVVLLTLVGVAIPRVVGPARLAFALLFAGIFVNLLADTSFAYTSLHGAYGALGAVLDMGWVAGYVLVALAAAASIGVVQAAPREWEPGMWHLALPWAAVLAVILTDFGVILTGRKFGPQLGWIGGTLGVLFVSGQALAASDSIGL